METPKAIVFLFVESSLWTIFFELKGRYPFGKLNGWYPFGSLRRLCHVRATSMESCDEIGRNLLSTEELRRALEISGRSGEFWKNLESSGESSRMGSVCLQKACNINVFVTNIKQHMEFVTKAGTRTSVQFIFVSWEIIVLSTRLQCKHQNCVSRKHVHLHFTSVFAF